MDERRCEFESGVAQENGEEVEIDRHCSTKGGGSGEVSGSEGEGNTLCTV